MTQFLRVWKFINRQWASEYAFNTETVDSGSIPDRFRAKTLKIGIYSFPACRSALEGQCEASTCVVDRWAGGNLNRRPKGPFAVS